MIHFFWKNSYRPGLTQMILYIYIFMMMMMFYTFRYIHHQRHTEFSFFRPNAKQADTVVTDGFDAFESIAELHSSTAVQSSTAAQLDTEMQLVHLPSFVNWTVFAEPQCSSSVEVCFEFCSLRAAHAYAIRCQWSIDGSGPSTVFTFLRAVHGNNNFNVFICHETVQRWLVVYFVFLHISDGSSFCKMVKSSD